MIWSLLPPMSLSELLTGHFHATCISDGLSLCPLTSHYFPQIPLLLLLLLPPTPLFSLSLPPSLPFQRRKSSNLRSVWTFMGPEKEVGREMECLGWGLDGERKERSWNMVPPRIGAHPTEDGPERGIGCRLVSQGEDCGLDLCLVPSLHHHSPQTLQGSRHKARRLAASFIGSRLHEGGN